MEQENKYAYVKKIAQKDEQAALSAAKRLLDEGDAGAFFVLSENVKYMFDFVKNNVNNRIARVSDVNNYKNLLKFAKIYSEDLEEGLVDGVLKFASEELSDEIFELLDSGTVEERAFAAAYFERIPDTVALESLVNNAFSDFDPLMINCAKALRAMNDKIAYEQAVSMLSSCDEFEKLKAVRFLCAFQDDEAVELVLKSIEQSSMAQNIAGELFYLMSPLEMLEKYDKISVFQAIEHVIDSLGEVLPLSSVLHFNFYGLFETLMLTENSSKKAVLNLKAKLKFKLLEENDEYTFDEDKFTKQELARIYELFNSKPEEFWAAQKALLPEEFSQSIPRVLSALDVIKELGIKEFAQNILPLLNSDDEIIVAQSIYALHALGSLTNVDKAAVLSSIKNENLRAPLENIF